MKVDGYRQELELDRVRVFIQAETELSLDVVLDNDLTGIEEIQVPVDPLRMAGQSISGRRVRSRGKRSRRRRRSQIHQIPETTHSFSLRLDDSTEQYEGFITADTPSALARFLHSHLICGSPPENEFEKWFTSQKEDVEEERFLSRLEAVLTDSEPSFNDSLPDYLVLASENVMEAMTLDKRYWYFNRDFYGLNVADLASTSVNGHAVPRLYFAKQIDESIVSFDGSEFKVAPADSMSARRNIASLEPNGRLVNELATDLLPMVQVEAACWLRIPTEGEAREAGLLDLERSDADKLALPAEVPPFCYLYDSLAPIPVPEPEALPVIESPLEVAAVLGRTIHGVLIGDKACEPPDPSIYQNDPAFMIMALPRVIKCV